MAWRSRLRAGLSSGAGCGSGATVAGNSAARSASAATGGSPRIGVERPAGDEHGQRQRHDADARHVQCRQQQAHRAVAHGQFDRQGDRGVQADAQGDPAPRHATRFDQIVAPAAKHLPHRRRGEGHHGHGMHVASAFRGRGPHCRPAWPRGAVHWQTSRARPCRRQPRDSGQSQRKRSSNRPRAASQSQAVELVHSASTPQTNGRGTCISKAVRWQNR